MTLLIRDRDSQLTANYAQKAFNQLNFHEEIGMWELCFHITCIYNNES